jgi:hypothetical protein
MSRKYDCLKDPISLGDIDQFLDPKYIDSPRIDHKKVDAVLEPIYGKINSNEGIRKAIAVHNLFRSDLRQFAAAYLDYRLSEAKELENKENNVMNSQEAKHTYEALQGMLDVAAKHEYKSQMIEICKMVDTEIAKIISSKRGQS